jgi:transcriptional regulator with XRE-family HTH domain
MAIRKSLHSLEYAVFLGALRQAREDAGVTQAELAKRIKQSQAFVSKSERGERRVDVIELRLFCKALKLDLHDFLRQIESGLKLRR